jgi:transposase
MALLRQIMGKPDLQLTFQSVGGIPNAPWQSAALYTDETGAKYLGTLDRKQIAVLVGVAPMNYDSGKKPGYRKTKGGPPDVRRALYMSTLTGIHYNPVLKPQYDQLVQRGKEKKVAITACMRKMLTILNAMMRDRQPFRLAVIA